MNPELAESKSKEEEDPLSTLIEKELTEDADIQKFEFKEFKDPRFLRNGGFGHIYTADWERHNIKVALKTIRPNDDEYNDLIISTFFRELKKFRQIPPHKHIISFHGITKDPVLDKYMLVLDYATKGDLRSFFTTHYGEMTWREKLRFAREIASGVQHLHDNGIIHRDLHSKNVLLNEDLTLLIADLGLAKSETSLLRPNQHGMVRYKDPQCFINPQYIGNYKSDIFSLGQLLWEVSSGRIPWSREDDANIPPLLKQGYREAPQDGTPIKYLKLYEMCWDQDPSKRPDINVVYKQLEKINLETCDYYFRPDDAPQDNHIPKESDSREYELALSIESLQLDPISRIKAEMRNLQEVGAAEIEMRDLRIKPKPNNSPTGFSDLDEKLIVSCLRYTFPCLAKRINLPQDSEVDTPQGKFRIESIIEEIKTHALLNARMNFFVAGLLNFSRDSANKGFLTMVKYYSNDTLFEYLQNAKLDCHERVQRSFQIAQGLDFLHQSGIIHPNLTSHHIYVDSEGSMKITDFGRYDISNLTKDILGVICYLDPKQISDAVDHPHTLIRLDRRFNIYSLGLLMWQMFSVKTPYYRPDSIGVDLDPKEFIDKIAQGYREETIEDTPQSYQDIYEKCWNKDINARLPVDRIIDELRNILNDQGGDNETSINPNSIEDHQEKNSNNDPSSINK